MLSTLRRWIERLTTIPKSVPAVDLSEHEDKIVMMLAMVVSAIVGLVVVAFVVLTEHLGSTLINAGPLKRFLIPVLGSLIGGVLLYRFFPDARGSGIPQTRVALLLQDGIIRFRTVVGKFLCSSISLGSGIALGREGPSVHIGAGIASIAARRLGLSTESVRSLIPVGTAAAVAAAFNTPLAAVLFTLEEILDDLHARVVGSVVIGAATSWIVLRLILGDEPLFHVPSYQLVHPAEFLIYALLGLAGGLVSTFFVKMLLWQRTLFSKVPASWRPVAPAAGGLVVGGLALAVPGVLGVGYNLVSEALNGQMALKMTLLLLLLKIIATSASYSSGNAGGIFGPSLFIGAMLGGSIGHIAHGLFPDHTGSVGAYALVGMGAAFAGIIRTPMTSVIMIFEVTRDYTIIVPLMIANLCSYFLSQRMQRTPIYQALSGQEGISMPSAEHRPEPLTVQCAMQPVQDGDVATAASVHPDDPLDMALQVLGRNGLSEVTVVSRTGGQLVGKLSRAGVMAAYDALSVPRAPGDVTRRPNRLPAVAIIMLAAITVFASVMFWRRSQRISEQSETYQRGEELLSQGRVDEAASTFRRALAQSPGNPETRAALGLALIRTGHLDEAQSYLSQTAKADPSRGPVWAGLADIALASGDKTRALQLYRQAVVKEWTPEDELVRWNAEFSYATLLGETGKKSEAVSQLLLLLGRRGDSPELSRKAADAVKAIGNAQQSEEAMRMLTEQFPADSSAWMRLGDARYFASKDSEALQAYRNAASLNVSDPSAIAAVARMEQVLRLDPTRAGLQLKERARRWDQLLERVLTNAQACRYDVQSAGVRALLSKRAATLDLVDQKMAAAKKIWQSAPGGCHSDEVVNHILRKLAD